MRWIFKIVEPNRTIMLHDKLRHAYMDEKNDLFIPLCLSEVTQRDIAMMEEFTDNDEGFVFYSNTCNKFGLIVYEKTK